MSNNIANVVPTILKYGALALREFAVMPRLVNVDYGNEVKQKGDTIDVTIPSLKASADVTPGTVPAGSVGDVSPAKMPIALSNWKEAGFVLSDKELAEMDANQVLSGEASEALKVLCNDVDKSIITKGLLLYGLSGTSGVVPSTVDSVIDCRKVLNTQLAPKSPRNLVIDGAVEANYLKLGMFTSKADSDTSAMIDGELGERFGLRIVNDQNIEGNTFTAGTGNGYESNGIHAKGSTTLTLKTGNGTVQVGDVFTIQNQTGNYVCVANPIAAVGTITIYPPLRAATANGDDITIVTTTGQQNLAFHRDCFSFASRPLETPQGLGVISSSVTDPVTGITLRLEVSRPHKQTRWSWDILWGVGCTRPELGIRQIGS